MFLKYFISEDSLVGIKNQKGEIIVPAQFRIFSVIENDELVKGENNFTRWMMMLKNFLLKNG